MRSVGSSKLADLQKSPGGIRNICILAHVDHGKTTLADSLVASNGIISQRHAGRLRYMDSRKDEQERGITMKSSSIALYHHKNEDEFLVNLIDSPGHVDFSTEVTTAVRLCDGAIIVVDVVEGVCAQTIVALRQAWQEDIKPILVLNKIDRMILELKFAPLDAYVHLTQVLEKVNVVMAELLSSEVGKEAFGTKKSPRSRTTSKCSDGGYAEYINRERDINEWSTGLDDIDDSQIYFSPEQGNVIFASALDGWGFRISDFARIYAAKVGFKEPVLNATLWGDFFMNTKLKRIMKGAQEKAKKPLFVQLILDNIWAMYDAIAIRKDKELVNKMVNNLSLEVHARDLKQTDTKQVLYAVMSKWLPLSSALLDTVCEKLPSPLQLTEAKVERLMFSHSRNFASLTKESQDLKQSFLECNSSDNAPVIIFVSKMFAIERKALPENRPKVLTAEDIAARREQARQRLAERLAQKVDQIDVNGAEPASEGEVCHFVKDDNDNNVNNPENMDEDAFIAFARVYSGTLKKGCKLYILGPRYDPVVGMEQYPNGEGIDPSATLKDLKAGQHVTTTEIQHLYQLMGRELEPLEEVPAGNILGIGGLDDHILKTATISSTLACPPFTDLNVIAVPILRVAIEPVKTADMAALVNGLRLLNQADPCVQILVQDTGEHVLVTAGEVHLQRCVDDIKERFAKVAVSVSKPIVPFRETIVQPPKTDMVNEIIENQQASSESKEKKSSSSNKESEKSDNGLIVQKTLNKRCTIKIRAAPLPEKVTEILDNSAVLLTVLKDNESLLKSGKLMSLPESVQDDITQLQGELSKAFEVGGWDPGTVDQIWSFGPKKCGPNILLNKIKNYKRGSVWPNNLINDGDELDNSKDFLSPFDSNFINGFQLATLAGPLCEEPMVGIAFIVEDWTIESEDSNETSSQPFGPFSGQIMSVVKDTCRKAFQAQPQRLMVAMYSCSIQVNSEVLGKLYAVLGKRGGRILHGDLQEGSTNFEVTAQLPVIESFDFANEVRRQTSGLALPQLVFSGWEVLEIDPFWSPTTEEEYLHFGEKADTENRARKYMNGVRKRKGLRVEEKIVEFAEKQRTLTRNK